MIPLFLNKAEPLGGRDWHDRPHAVYAAFDWTGEPLYVGVTSDLRQRLRAHQLYSPWWVMADSFEFHFMPDYDAGMRREWARIKELRPRFNIVGNREGAGRGKYSRERVSA